MPFLALTLLYLNNQRRILAQLYNKYLINGILIIALLVFLIPEIDIQESYAVTVLNIEIPRTQYIYNDNVYISELNPIKSESITTGELRKAACCDLAGCFGTQTHSIER